MRNLVYITTDSWWDSDINIIPNLSEHFKLEVIVLSHAKKNENKYPIKEVPENVKLHNFTFSRSKKDIRMLFCSFLYGFYLLYKVSGKISFWVYDGVQIHSFLFGLFVIKSNSIISFHNFEEHTNSHWYSKKFQSMMLSRFKLFHFQSPSQEIAFKYNFPNKKSFSTAMPPKNFGPPLIKELYFDNSYRTFLFFGYIRKYKHPEMFIEVANKLKRKANFIIAGYAKDWTNYQKLIDNDNPMLCHIRFINNEDIPNYYCQSHFIVLPYEDSTQSGPLLIAYNYGVPAIVSNLPYFKQMVTNDFTGFVFEKGDQEDLQKCIEKAINLSDEQYCHIKENLKRKVNNYKKDIDFAVKLHKFINGTKS